MKFDVGDYDLISHLHLGLSRESVRPEIFWTQLPRTAFSHQAS